MKIRQRTRNTIFTVTFFQAETCTPLKLIKKGAELLFLNRVQWLFLSREGAVLLLGWFWLVRPFCKRVSTFCSDKNEQRKKRTCNYSFRADWKSSQNLPLPVSSCCVPNFHPCSFYFLSLQTKFINITKLGRPKSQEKTRFFLTKLVERWKSLPKLIWNIWDMDEEASGLTVMKWARYT